MSTTLKDLLSSYSVWLKHDSQCCTLQLQKEQMHWALAEPNFDNHPRGYPLTQNLNKIAQSIFINLATASNYFKKDENDLLTKLLCVVQVPTIINLMETSAFLVFNCLRVIRYALITFFRLGLFVFGGFLVKEAGKALKIAIDTLLKDLANQILIVIERIVWLIETFFLSIYHVFKDNNGTNNFSCEITVKVHVACNRIREQYNYQYREAQGINS